MPTRDLLTGTGTGTGTAPAPPLSQVPQHRPHQECHRAARLPAPSHRTATASDTAAASHITATAVGAAACRTAATAMVSATAGSASAAAATRCCCRPRVAFAAAAPIGRLCRPRCKRPRRRLRRPPVRPGHAAPLLHPLRRRRMEADSAAPELGERGRPDLPKLLAPQALSPLAADGAGDTGTGQARTLAADGRKVRQASRRHAGAGTHRAIARPAVPAASRPRL